MKCSVQQQTMFAFCVVVRRQVGELQQTKQQKSGKSISCQAGGGIKNKNTYLALDWRLLTQAPDDI